MTLRSKKIVSFSPRGIIGHLTERKEVLLSNPFRQYLDQLRFRVEDGEQPIGSLISYLGATAPKGWLFCTGQAVSKSTYANLYVVIGDQFGSTSDTFTLPDLSNRFLVGAGSIAALMTTAGAETVTLTEAQLPSHSHTVTDPGHSHAVTDPEHSHAVTDPEHSHAVTDAGHTHTASAPAGAADSAAGADTTSATAGSTGSSTTGVTVDSEATGVTVDSAETGVTVDSAETGITVGNTGGGAAVNITPPALGVNWIIRT